MIDESDLQPVSDPDPATHEGPVFDEQALTLKSVSLRPCQRGSPHLSLVFGALPLKTIETQCGCSIKYATLKRAFFLCKSLYTWTVPRLKMQTSPLRMRTGSTTPACMGESSSICLSRPDQPLASLSLRVRPVL